MSVVAGRGPFCSRVMVVLYNSIAVSSNWQQQTVFTARCYAERGIAMASCLSVRLSVCP